MSGCDEVALGNSANTAPAAALHSNCYDHINHTCLDEASRVLIRCSLQGLAQAAGPRPAQPASAPRCTQSPGPHPPCPRTSSPCIRPRVLRCLSA
eukprot:scaffold62599_cov66-Phaeocystis_antarctica.AAC.3